MPFSTVKKGRKNIKNAYESWQKTLKILDWGKILWKFIDIHKIKEEIRKDGNKC